MKRIVCRHGRGLLIAGLVIPAVQARDAHPYG